MANEIHVNYKSGVTLYAVRFNSSGQAALSDGSAFEDWGTGGHDADDYDVALTEVGSGSGHYTGDFDADGNITTAGTYIVVAFVQNGANPADSDGMIADGTVIWEGSYVAPAAQQASNYAESFLTRAIAAVRSNTDEPAINVKYTDADIIGELERAYPVIIGEINRNTKTPVVGRTNLTITSSDMTYVLPYHIGAVYAIYKHTSEGARLIYNPRSRFNPLGRYVWIEGSTLHIQNVNVLPAGLVLTIEYIPAGTARLHNGTCSVNSDGNEVTFATTPNAGTLDTHENAYAGCVLRILKVTGTGAVGDYIQERTITAYDRTTRIATLDVALDPVPAAGSGGHIMYEVAPSIWKGLDETIATYAAYVIVSIEGNAEKAKALSNIYRDQLRNLRLSGYYSLLQSAPQVSPDNFDVRRYRRI